MNKLGNFATAIEENDSPLIKSLLAKREVDANARLPRDNNPPALVHATEGGCVEIIELLLNSGARIDDVDNVGRCACHVAAQRGRADVMRVLLAHRPNLALRKTNGKTALQTATQALFRSDGNEADKVDVAMLLIHAGAALSDLDARDMCKFAATSIAAIQVLIEHNVVLRDLRGEFGQTALHIATRNRGDFAVLRKLIDCGVDVEALDSRLSTCSSFAITSNYADALRLFLQAGADANGADGGAILLHRSVAWKRLPCMILLLAAGADVTARDANGRTACHLAATKSEPMSFVHAMVAAGADLDAADDNDQTPRQCLAEHQLTVDPERVEAARQKIAKMRLDFVRHRALQICTGLQSLQLDALQVCEILQLACGPLARLIAFHQWWKIATTVKHFHQH
jgi:ankyrin repeat protein